MKDYLRNRVRLDAQHAINIAEAQASLQHAGLKGRLRELVAVQLFTPWLPPYAVCGTGMVINGKDDRYRQFTQDDIIVFDRTLIPPILVRDVAHEGIFLNNGVLLRVEVKSTLKAEHVDPFIRASLEFCKIGFVARQEMDIGALISCSALLAFGGSINFPNFAASFSEVGAPPSVASTICVLGQGLWMLRPMPGADKLVAWYRLATDSPEDQLACFVATVSDTVFEQHKVRTGLRNGCGAGIGLYFPALEEWQVASKPIAGLIP